jgi:hypothetical protein
MDRRQLLIFATALAAALPGASAAATDEKKKGGGVSFIQLDTVTASITRPNGRRGVLTLDVGVDVPDEKLRERARLVAPRLRAAFVQVLQTYASGLPLGALPNADFLAMELQRETDRVLGRKGARLLLGTMLMN